MNGLQARGPELRDKKGKTMILQRRTADLSGKAGKDKKEPEKCAHDFEHENRFQMWQNRTFETRLVVKTAQVLSSRRQLFAARCFKFRP
jgi:hypothetical protein